MRKRTGECEYSGPCDYRQPEPHGVSASGSNELLCCPFCGGRVDISLSSMNGRTEIKIGCETEYCFGSIYDSCVMTEYEHDGYEFHTTKEDAIKAWNTRT